VTIHILISVSAPTLTQINFYLVLPRTRTGPASCAYRRRFLYIFNSGSNMGCACDVVLSHFLAITARAQLESKDVALPINVARGRNAFHRLPSQAVPNKFFPTGPPIGLDVSEPHAARTRVTKLMAQLRMRGPSDSYVKTVTLKTIAKKTLSQILSRGRGLGTDESTHKEGPLQNTFACEAFCPSLSS
jgi:hypothetical protein